MTFSASVRWSGRSGRHEVIASTPYTVADATTNSTAATNVSASRRRRRRSPSTSESSSSSEEDGPQYRYIDIELASSGLARDHFKYVNRTFEDVEDGGIFRVIGVCEMRKLRGRNSTNIVYAFKYIDIENESEVHYTPVTEILNSYWAKWKDDIRCSTSSAGASRAFRASRRQTNSL